MLDVRNLQKSYSSAQAVAGISFNLPKGSVTVILGPNGAGKSTTIKAIVGLINFEGSITIDGITNTDIAAKKKMSYVPEIPALFPYLTVREHIEYMSKAYGVDSNPEDIDELLRYFELDDKQKKFGDELSKGMMQKVSIASSLIVNPDLLILDEPMVGLDPLAIKRLKERIHTLKDEGKTILISTHMLEMVENIWDHVIVMDKGRVKHEINREDSQDMDLESIFFGITGSPEVSDHE